MKRSVRENANITSAWHLLLRKYFHPGTGLLRQSRDPRNSPLRLCCTQNSQNLKNAHLNMLYTNTGHFQLRMCPRGKRCIRRHQVDSDISRNCKMYTGSTHSIEPFSQQRNRSMPHCYPSRCIAQRHIQCMRQSPNNCNSQDYTRGNFPLHWVNANRRYMACMLSLLSLYLCRSQRGT